MTDWRNRIIGLNKYPVHQLLANPFNPRRHPGAQRDAIRGSLDALGIVAPVIQNTRTGHILDGHLRIEEYLTKDENAEIDVLDVDLSEDEEKLFLASFDYITSLANYDRDTLDALLRDVNTDNAALQSLLSDLAEQNHVIPSLDYGNTFTDEGGEDATDYELQPSHVRMVQLFLSDANLDEFNLLVDQLKKRFDVTSVTDVVFEAVRYAANHSA